MSPAAFNNARSARATPPRRPRCARYPCTSCFDCLSVIFVEKCLCLHPRYNRASAFLSHSGKRRSRETRLSLGLTDPGSRGPLPRGKRDGNRPSSTGRARPSVGDDDDRRRRSSFAPRPGLQQCPKSRISSSCASICPRDREIARVSAKSPREASPSYLTKKKVSPPRMKGSPVRGGGRATGEREPRSRRRVVLWKTARSIADKSWTWTQFFVPDGGNNAW